MKDKNLPLRENANFNERQLIAKEEWKLPKKNLSYTSLVKSILVDNWYFSVNMQYYLILK